MPEAMRVLDPLIEACRHMEAASARSPGFGEALHDWLRPFYADRSPAEHRLILAACLLHDVNWRAHPDYRAELCFESVTRANIAGIGHADRVFLGLALLNRYKAVAPVEEVERFRGLLSPERAAEAAVLGRAMRLGAMLSGSSIGVLDHATLVREGGRIVLTLRGAGARVRRRAGGAAAADARGAAGLQGRDRARGLSDGRRNEKRPAMTGRSQAFPPRPGPAPTGRLPRSGSQTSRFPRVSIPEAFPCTAARTKPASCVGCNAEMTGAQGSGRFHASRADRAQGDPV